MQQEQRSGTISLLGRWDTTWIVGYVLMAGLSLFQQNLHQGQAVGMGGVVVAGLSATLFSLWGTAVAAGQILPQHAQLRADRVGSLIDLVWFFLLLVLGIPVAFGLLCQNCASVFGGFVGMPHGSPDTAWAGFAYSWIDDSVTFNASQVFGWMTTPIQATAWWARTLIVMFSLVSDLIVVAGVVTIMRRVVDLFRA